MKFKIVSLLIFSLIITQGCIFQKSNIDDAQLTEEFIEGDIFIESIDFYERFLIDNPNDADFNYKMGFALLNTKTREKESIEYFNRAKGLFTKSSEKYMPILLQP